MEVKASVDSPCTFRRALEDITKQYYSFRVRLEQQYLDKHRLSLRALTSKKLFIDECVATIMSHQKLVDTLDSFDDEEDSSDMAASSVVNEMWANDEKVVREKALQLFKKACNIAAVRVHDRLAANEKHDKVRRNLVSSLTTATPKALFANAVREAVGKGKGKGKGKKGQPDGIRAPPGLTVDWHGLGASHSTRPSDFTSAETTAVANAATALYVRPSGVSPSMAGKTAKRWQQANSKGKGKGKDSKPSGKGKGKGKEKGKGKDKGSGKGPKGKGKDSGKAKGDRPAGKGRGKSRGRGGRGRGRQ
jgi:hypothetical protein